MAGWHHQWNGHELGQTLGDGEGQGDLLGCSPWGHKESDMTEWLNNSKGPPHKQRMVTSGWVWDSWNTARYLTTNQSEEILHMVEDKEDSDSLLKWLTAINFPSFPLKVLSQSSRVFEVDSWTCIYLPSTHGANLPPFLSIITCLLSSEQPSLSLVTIW